MHQASFIQRVTLLADRPPYALTGYLFAVGATALWSGNFIIARGLNESIPPISLAFWRWVVAVIVFLPFAWKPLAASRPILKKHLPYLAITALLGITIFNTLIYFAGQTTTAINLSLISITFPIFIVIIARLVFHELFTRNKIAGIILVVTGVVLLITRGNWNLLLSIHFTIGDLWMLCAAVIFAVYSILLKHRPAGLSIWALQLSTFILGLVFLLPFFVWEWYVTAPVSYDSKVVGSILYVGVFASLTAFVFWNKAIAVVGPVKAAMIYYTLPLFSGLLAHLFLGEEIGSLHLYCLVLIVAGILIANYGTPVATTEEPIAK